MLAAAEPRKLGYIINRVFRVAEKALRNTYPSLDDRSVDRTPRELTETSLEFAFR
jgi:hypothetical protein